MSEMIERVARAIWQRRTGGNWEARMKLLTADQATKERCLREGVHPDCFNATEDVTSAFDDARAAIEAMRSPTDAMVTLGWQLIHGNLRPDEIYPHMIDAALK